MTTTSLTISAPSEDESVTPRVVAFAWIDHSAREWTETLAALARIEVIEAIHVAFLDAKWRPTIKLIDHKLHFLEVDTLDQAAEKVFATAADQILFITSPVIPSQDVLDTALAWMEDDPRIGTVSFLSNSAGYLSFPHRNTETPFGPDGHDETTLTALLRARRPKNSGPVPCVDAPTRTHEATH